MAFRWKTNGAWTRVETGQSGPLPVSGATTTVQAIRYAGTFTVPVSLEDLDIVYEDDRIFIQTSAGLPSFTYQATAAPWAALMPDPVRAYLADLAAGPVYVVPLRITGTPAPGQTLTAQPGLVLSNAADPEPVDAWQWRRDGVAIAGATAATYTITAADGGHTISVTDPSAVTGSTSAGVSVPSVASTLAGTGGIGKLTITSRGTVAAPSGSGGVGKLTITARG